METSRVRLCLLPLVAAFTSLAAPALLPKPLHATFVNFYRDLTQQQWAREFQDMQAVGIQTVVIVSVGHLEPSGQEIASEGLLYPSRYLSPAHALKTDRLEMILSLADRQGMEVYVGSLQTSGDWTGGGEFEALRVNNQRVAAEIVSRYGHHASLRGWYFTQEIWMNWVKYYGSGYYGTKLLADWVADMKRIDPDKLTTATMVMKECANGAMPALAAPELRPLTASFLEATKLDILMPQDGVGAMAGAPSLEDLPAYFAAMAAGASQAGTGASIWSVLELFTANAGDSERFPPAGPVRIQAQIERVRPYVAGYISWIFGDHMSSQATFYPTEAAQLYRQYQLLNLAR